MRCARVLGFGLLLGMSAACARDEAPAQDSDPAVSPPASDVVPASSVVAAPPVGAWVRVSQERLLSAASVHAGLVIAYEEPFRTAEVVAVEGELVELRTIAAKPEDLCATSSGADPNFEIHFFAEIDALEPVLVTPKIVEFDDGTKLEFAAGVPVDLSGAEPSLQLGSAKFIVPLAKPEIGWWFPAAPAQLPAASPSAWSRARPLYYGERSVEPDGPPFADVRDRRSLDDSNELLTFADACGRFTLRVEDEPTTPGRSGLYQMKGPSDAIPRMARDFDPDMAARNAGILGVIAHDDGSWETRSPCGPVVEAPSGVALTWQDSGKIAGVTRANVRLPMDAHEAAGKLCFTTDDMSVCIASDLLTRKDSSCVRSPADFGILPDGPGGGDPVGPSDAGEQGLLVRQLKAEVSAGLDADIVRRIVRAHIEELRRCYEGGRAKQPQLTGSITIAFEIGANGKVSSSTVHEATLSPADEALPKCFAKAVKRWQFPKPEGPEPVSVTYPFELLSR